MRKLWIRSVALSLGLLVTGARGQEDQWRMPRSSAPPKVPQSVALGKPVPIASSRPGAAAAAGAPAPAVSLGRPIASTTGRRDDQVQPVSFQGQRNPLAPVVRGSAPESVSRPMPVGPLRESAGMPAQGMHSWRRPDEVVATTVSRNGATGTETSAAPPPAGSGGLLVAPTPLNPMPMPMPGSAPPPMGMGSGSGVPMPGTTGAPAPGGSAPPIITTDPGVVFPAPTVISGPGVIANGGVPLTCGPGCCASTCCPGMGAGCGAWGGCCPDAPRLIVGGEFLLWWLKGDVTPPLVTVAPPDQIPFLNNPNAQVVVGGSRFADNVRPGARFNLQYWFTDNHCWGIDGSGFFLGNADNTRATYEDSGNLMSIGRPFINATPGEGVIGLQEVASPNLAGRVTVERQSNLWGFEANLRRNVWCGEMFTFDFVFGGRVLGLDESISITENLLVKVPPQGSIFQVGDAIVVQDRFVTQNRFYGGQIGIDGEYRYGAFTLGLRSRLALGSTHQFLQIQGDTTLNGNQLRNNSGPGGLLALSGTNVGGYSRKMFGVIPEVGLTLGYDIFDWWRITAGYNFMYWNSVVRPGEQINLTVNRNFIPGRTPTPNVGTPNPTPQFHSSDLYIHGVTLGMEFRY